jgi:hypothetical protein
MSIPCDVISAFTAARACTKRAASRDDLAVCIWSTNLNIQNNPDISSLHNFIQNTQPSGQSPTSRKLGSLNDVFASRPATNSKNPGGGGRDRTDDPLLAKQVLSQLSYAPVRYG